MLGHGGRMPYRQAVQRRVVERHQDALVDGRVAGSRLRQDHRRASEARRRRIQGSKVTHSSNAE